MKTPLSPMEEKIFQFIKTYDEKYDCSPPYPVMMKKFKLSKERISFICRTLEKKRWLTFTIPKQRRIVRFL
jgi:hypothetical protein